MTCFISVTECMKKGTSGKPVYFVLHILVVKLIGPKKVCQKEWKAAGHTFRKQRVMKESCHLILAPLIQFRIKALLTFSSELPISINLIKKFPQSYAQQLISLLLTTPFKLQVRFTIAAR